MVKILSGEIIAKQILGNLKKKKTRKKLCLAVIQIGENKVSQKYVQEKQKVAKELGVGFCSIVFSSTISQTKLEKEITKIGKDAKVSGMIIQLPLPKQFNAQSILDCIPKEKDIDVLSIASFSEFALGTLSILPPTVQAISLLLLETKKKIEGAQVVVVGAGRLVGLPVSLWLVQQGAVVSLVQKGTKNAGAIILKSDIVISGVGKSGLITGKMIKKGAVVIDAGTSVEGGSTKGDVEFESVSKKASYLSTVPGGVGPLTVACLLKNLFSLND